MAAPDGRMLGGERMGPDVAKALVVDDDPGLLGVYAEVLREESYEVDTASTGGQATERLAAGRYDVMLCDMVLPDSSGLEVMQAARRVGLDLPIVLITGHPTLQTAVMAVEKGASRYLQKPVSREQLLTTLETVIREHRSGARDREVRARSADAQRALDGAFEAALASISTACDPVVSLPGGELRAYCAVGADRSRGLSYSLAMLRAARQLGRQEAYSRALRVSAVAVRRISGRGHPLIVPVPLSDVEVDRLFEDEEPLQALASDVVLDIWPAVPRDRGKAIVGKLESLRAAGYRLALPVPRPEAPDLSARELGPVDFLRLDDDLLTDLERDPVRQALIRRAAAAAAEGEARLLACGFATPERRALLADLGCGLLQVCRRGEADVARADRAGTRRAVGWWSRLWSLPNG